MVTSAVFIESGYCMALHMSVHHRTEYAGMSCSNAGNVLQANQDIWQVPTTGTAPFCTSCLLMCMHGPKRVNNEHTARLICRLTTNQMLKDCV